MNECSATLPDTPAQQTGCAGAGWWRKCVHTIQHWQAPDRAVLTRTCKIYLPTIPTGNFWWRSAPETCRSVAVWTQQCVSHWRIFHQSGTVHSVPVTFRIVWISLYKYRNQCQLLFPNYRYRSPSASDVLIYGISCIQSTYITTHFSIYDCYVSCIWSHRKSTGICSIIQMIVVLLTTVALPFNLYCECIVLWCILPLKNYICGHCVLLVMASKCPMCVYPTVVIIGWEEFSTAVIFW